MRNGMQHLEPFEPIGRRIIAAYQRCRVRGTDRAYRVGPTVFAREPNLAGFKLVSKALCVLRMLHAGSPHQSRD